MTRYSNMVNGRWTLIDEISFMGWRCPPTFQSDGITGASDSVDGVDLRDAGFLHDFIRRYDLLAAFQASVLLARHLRHLGALRRTAWSYGLVSWLMAWKYRKHETLPPEWAEYAKPIE
jgi:hypothetical protein